VEGRAAVVIALIDVCTVLDQNLVGTRTIIMFSIIIIIIIRNPAYPPSRTTLGSARMNT
jgi:hypothetical protein